MTSLSNFVILLTVAGSAYAACPNIVSRAGWGARAPTSTTPLTTSPTPYVVIHHGGDSAYCTSETSCKSVLKSYQNQHMDVNGWADIGYNFVVGEDGNAYEGRGWKNAGAHAPGYNFNSIGICVPGDFTSKSPNAAALSSVQNLIDCGVSQGWIRSDYKLLGHRQALATECPGNTYFNVIKGWPHWTANP